MSFVLGHPPALPQVFLLPPAMANLDLLNPICFKCSGIIHAYTDEYFLGPSGPGRRVGGGVGDGDGGGKPLANLTPQPTCTGLNIP